GRLLVPRIMDDLSAALCLGVAYLILTLAAHYTHNRILIGGMLVAYCLAGTFGKTAYARMAIKDIDKVVTETPDERDRLRQLKDRGSARGAILLSVLALYFLAGILLEALKF